MGWLCVACSSSTIQKVPGTCWLKAGMSGALALKRLVVEHLWLAPVLHIVECRGPAKGGDAILQVTCC